MIFVKAITTPANTPSTAKQQTIIPLVAGKITLVMIQFPPGVNALAHIQLNRGLHQLFPTNQDADFASGAETIPWDEDYNLNTDPLQLEAYTWNEDTTYDHTITVRIVMVESVNELLLAAEIARLLASSPAPAEGQTTYPAITS